MYDLSAKFNTFYTSKVVLSQDEQNKLHQKANLNIQRLKDGLKEYNKDNDTNYVIQETCVQGSVAMSTVVQNDDNDYDIDVAIVFDKEDLRDKGALATRNMVAAALKDKTKQFNTAPEVKTSCVRVSYAEGYHIDFAIYRRTYNESLECWEYEHSGSEWTKRDLRGLTDWFKEKNDLSDGKLRKVVRLSKMFCKSREIWKNMPSGLLQTVVCNEELQNVYTRIDELFYYTMEAIIKRLDVYTSVSAPVDDGRNLTPRKIDKKKMTNWKNRLKSKIEDLDVLFKDDCTEDEAIQAWYGFFNHVYWDQNTSSLESASNSNYYVVKVRSFAETEQFIEDLYTYCPLYKCRISCQVSGNGFRPKPIAQFMTMLSRYLPHNFEIRCEMEYTDCPPPYKIMWKVKNVGPEAERRNMLRGQIFEKGDRIIEHSNFYGNHYIECYIIKDERCVAKQRVDIPIGRR